LAGRISLCHVAELPIPSAVAGTGSNYRVGIRCRASAYQIIADAAKKKTPGGFPPGALN
jgi:hypothetical protein